MRDGLLFVLAGVAALVYLVYTITRGSGRARSRSRWDGGGDVGGSDGGGHGGHGGHGDCGDGGGDGGGGDGGGGGGD